MPQKITQCETKVPVLRGVTVTVEGGLVTVTVWSKPMSGAVMPCSPCVLTNFRLIVSLCLSVTIAGENAKFLAVIDFQTARECFSEAELVTLTLAIIIAINGWNRIAISFGSLPGTYQIGDGRPKAKTQ